MDGDMAAQITTLDVIRSGRDSAPPSAGMGGMVCSIRMDGDRMSYIDILYY